MKQKLLMVIILVGVGFSLAACTHGVGTLLFSNLGLAEGETGTVTLTAADMGRFNSLQIGPNGKITYDASVIHVLNVEGASGFIVFAFETDNVNGEVTLAAGSTSGPVSDGPVLSITVRAVGTAGSLTAINITELDFVVNVNEDPIPGVSIVAGQITVN
jgi:hypothetical protein